MIYESMDYSRGFESENPDFAFLRVSQSDGRFFRTLKKIGSYLTSSIRFTVIHSESIRRYIFLRSNSTGRTLEKLMNVSNMKKDEPDPIATIETDNGTMVSHLHVEEFIVLLRDVIQKWMSSHSVQKRRDHRESGFYKKLLRIHILIDHVRYIYSDKYNVYQAAYITGGYIFRASLCFTMQVVSVYALISDTPGEDITGGPRSVGDYILIVVTLMYMFFNIPANYMTSNMSQGIVMLNIFYGLGMYSRMAFVLMDILINTMLMTFLPVVSARLLSGTTLSTEIVTRSLSVMFITSLDDQAVTKGESNRFLESQESFIKNMIERVDHYDDSDGLDFIRYIPWVENAALLVSVIAAYIILFIT